MSMSRDIPSASDLEKRKLHAALEGCPIGAAIVAHGRLCFANALFAENTRLATGVDDLRVVFDDAPSRPAPPGQGGAPAALCWHAADGIEHRVSLIAHPAPYGKEDAFFLWMPELAGDAPPAAKAKGRILLAEDNEINQEIVTELLGQAGVELQVASNGKEAVDLFLQNDFDLILMDIQMPLMDGIEAARTIRASGKTGADTVPILAMTAHESENEREKCLQAGMNAHLVKPVEPRLLFATLDTWLSGGARAPVTATANTTDTAPAPAPPAAMPPEIPQQDILSRLQGFDAQAGLSNVAGNRELYLRLLGRFASNYRNSGVKLRNALRRAEHDPSAHEEAVRLAHTAKGVAANLGASALAAIAGELENALKKGVTPEEMLTRYDQLLQKALDSIAALPKRDEAHIGGKVISAADKERIAAVLHILPALMETDWYGAQQKLLALMPVVEGTVASAHFKEVAMALEDFDSASVADKGERLLRHIGVFEQGETG
jgi:CheY-like chemotaxis protein